MSEKENINMAIFFLILLNIKNHIDNVLDLHLKKIPK